MMDYVVLDIENPNSRNNSICAIGLIVVKKGEVVERKYSLINPQDRFDRTNTEITGISESMVLDQPTLKEYWPEIKELLSTEIIIGHNIKYDLSVLSKALYRYEIPVPEFNYICTLELSRLLIDSPSYNLGHLIRSFGFNYNEHNALEDAEAAHYLFWHIIDKFGTNDIEVKTYNYVYRLKEKVDSKLATNINNLYGIINGINYDGIVDEKEVEYLNQWIEDNLKYRDYVLFNRIITKLEAVLEDGIVTDFERKELLVIVDSINHSKLYSDATLSIQVLEGLLKGIICNSEIKTAEILNLQSWLDSNDYLSGVYPYDKIVNAVEKTIEDGILTEEEKEYLSIEFDEILNPTYSCESIELDGKSFCLSGDFERGTKSEIEEKLVAHGAIRKSGVSSKVDYLFVGGLGSEAWKYGNVGGKIAKALELQEKGSKIKIIGEDDLMCAIG